MNVQLIASVQITATLDGSGGLIVSPSLVPPPAGGSSATGSASPILLTTANVPVNLDLEAVVTSTPSGAHLAFTVANADAEALAAQTPPAAPVTGSGQTAQVQPVAGS